MVSAWELFEPSLRNTFRPGAKRLNFRCDEDGIANTIIFVFLVLAIVFHFNMLTAQLSCQYAAFHKNMVGHARSDRICIIANTMPMVSKRRWEVFSGSSASTWVNPVSPRRSAFGSYRIAATLGTPVLGPSRKSMFRRWSCYQFLCGHNCARSSSSPSCRSTRRSLSSPVGTAFHAVAL